MVGTGTRARWGRAALAVVLFGATAEGTGRALGWQPHVPPELTLTFTPSGWSHPDDRFGIGLGAGTFEGHAGRVVWTATHDAAGWRRVPGAAEGPPTVAVLGGSFVYGFGVDDDRTLAARLQGAWSEARVAVRAVPGWGLAQVWLALDPLLAQRPPPLLVLGYAAFLDERTLMLRHWKRSLAPFVDAHDLAAARWPYLAPEGDTFAVRWTSMAYRPWPGAQVSCVVARLEAAALTAEDRRARPHEVAVDVLVDLTARARDAGARLIVLGLDDDPITDAVLTQAAARGVETLPTDVPRTGEWTLLPDDPHPSEVAIARWAATLTAHLPRPPEARTETMRVVP